MRLVTFQKNGTPPKAGAILDDNSRVVVEPAEIGSAAYYQLTYEGWATLEQISIKDCDNRVDELKQRAQRHFARLVEEMREASRAR